MKNCACKDKRYHANAILGIGRNFGSKSSYHQENPQSNPIFNGSLLAQNEYGELEKIWHGDIEATNNTDLGMLKILAKTVKSDLYLYRESTVNNHTINGRRFPYEFPALIIKTNGEIEEGPGL